MLSKANCLQGVAVSSTKCFTWRGEEDSSQVFIVGDLEDFSCDVYQPASHRWDPPEVQDPNDMDEIQKKTLLQL